MLHGFSPDLARCALNPIERQRLLASGAMQILPPAPRQRGRYVSRGINRTGGLTTKTAAAWLRGEFHPSLTIADIARQRGLHPESLRGRICYLRYAPRSPQAAK